MNNPPPDVEQSLSFVPELSIVAVLYGDDNWARAVITKDGNGLYRIHSERWDISDFAVVGEAFWSQCDTGISIFNDLDPARDAAISALKLITRTAVFPYE